MSYDDTKRPIFHKSRAGETSLFLFYANDYWWIKKQGRRIQNMNCFFFALISNAKENNQSDAFKILLFLLTNLEFKGIRNHQ